MLKENVINEWYDCNSKLTELKKREMELRKHIVDDLLGGQLKATRKVELHGFELQANTKVSYSIRDKAKLTQYLKTAPDREIGCVKWTPSVYIKDYEALFHDSGLREFVTVKPVAPTLKVISVLE